MKCSGSIHHFATLDSEACECGSETMPLTGLRPAGAFKTISIPASALPPPDISVFSFGAYHSNPDKRPRHLRLIQGGKDA